MMIDKFIRDIVQQVTFKLLNYISYMTLNVKSPPGSLVPLKGDGSDEGTAIQALFDYCETNKKNIYFPSGIYGTTIPLTCTGRFTISGERGNTMIKALNTMDTLLTIYNDLTVILNDNMNRFGQILGITLNGDTKANTCFYIKQCKMFAVKGCQFTRPVVQCCVLGGESGKKVYELIMDDVVFTATNDTGQAQYGMVINVLTDSWLSKLLMINGSVNWLKIVSASNTSFISVHAYAYHENLAPDTGIDVNSNGLLLFENIYMDTVKRVGMNITGLGVTLKDADVIFKTGFMDTGTGDMCAVYVTGNTHVLDTIKIAMPDNANSARTSIVIYDNVTNVKYDFYCWYLLCHTGTTVNTDLKLIGKIPERLNFKGATQVTAAFRKDNFYFSKVFVEIGETTKAFAFKNERQTSVYKVNIMCSWNTTKWVTAMASTGFTVNFGTAPVAQGYVLVSVEELY